MGIMTVGLLGVASVFPVGSWYANKALVADQGSAIAQSVMNDLLTRGMLNPDAWFIMTPSPLSAVATSPNFRYATADGKYTGTILTQVPGKFMRPFSESLSEGIRQNQLLKQTNLIPANDKSLLAKQFGHAYVIDPNFTAAASTNTNVSDGRANVAAYAFPAGACYVYPWPGATYYGNAAWNPWRATVGGAPSASDKTWPIRRVTFAMSNGYPLDKSSAESISRGSDDLAYDFPDRDDRPSVQTWDTTTTTNGTQIPMARKWTGDYSWIASVVPTTNAARDGMARNPEGFAYDVSVVVFHKRPLPPSPPANQGQLPDAVAYERAVSAAIISTGLNGGELLLTQPMNGGNPVDNVAASPFDNLKSGQWIMICGPHPNSSDTEPRFVLNWYQVKAIDKTGTAIPNFNPNTQRVVTVRGPQWPWSPSTSLNGNYKSLSDDLCVGIFRGAVAVHTKTIRLESPLGSSYGTGMSVVTPPGSTPGNVLRQ